MSLLDFNKMQIELMGDSEMDTRDWIEEYSEKFRIIVEGGVSNFDKIKFFLYED